MTEGSSAIRELGRSVVFAPSSQQLEVVLTAMLARALRVDVVEIDVDRPLEEYGLDSLDAVILIGDFEDELNVELPETLLWDHPTVVAIAGFLADRWKHLPSI